VTNGPWEMARDEKSCSLTIALPQVASHLDRHKRHLVADHIRLVVTLQRGRHHPETPATPRCISPSRSLSLPPPNATPRSAVVKLGLFRSLCDECVQTRARAPRPALKGLGIRTTLHTWRGWVDAFLHERSAEVKHRCQSLWERKCNCNTPCLEDFHQSPLFGNRDQKQNSLRAKNEVCL